VLQHEAEMSQRLDHPGVLRVDAPERDGEQVFLPMECADGGDVRALRGAPWRQVLQVLLQVATILEHAHSRGVVHRDIKPGNVLFGADGAVRVTDFGTAARTGSTLALADGSPFSASPQQLAGQAATTSDDIYGLGALAYELLSRYPPYYPEFDARRVQQEMPAPLAAVHPTPPQLLAFIMSMLDREPQGRPDLRQVMDFFALCLQQQSAVQDSGAAMVVPESRPGSAPASTTRAGMRVATVALAVAAVGAAALFMFLPSPTARNVDASTPAPARPIVRPPATPEAAPSEQAGNVQRELGCADALGHRAVARRLQRALLRDWQAAARRHRVSEARQGAGCLVRRHACQTAGGCWRRSRAESALALNASSRPREGLSRVQENPRRHSSRHWRRQRPRWPPAAWMTPRRVPARRHAGRRHEVSKARNASRRSAGDLNARPRPAQGWKNRKVERIAGALSDRARAR
jgi:hypothetical protein